MELYRKGGPVFPRFHPQNHSFIHSFIIYGKVCYKMENILMVTAGRDTSSVESSRLL